MTTLISNQPSFENSNKKSTKKSNKKSVDDIFSQMRITLARSIAHQILFKEMCDQHAKAREMVTFAWPSALLVTPFVFDFIEEEYASFDETNIDDIWPPDLLFQDEIDDVCGRREKADQQNMTKEAREQIENECDNEFIQITSQRLLQIEVYRQLKALR